VNQATGYKGVWGLVGITPRILTWAPDEAKWPVTCPDRFTTWYRNTGTRWIGDRDNHIWFQGFGEEYVDLKKKAKLKDGGENYIISSFMICIVHRTLSRLCDVCNSNYTEVPHRVIFFRLPDT
jgi:hypothetical protein